MPKRQKKNRGPRNLEPVLEPEASHVVTRYDTQETEPGPKAKPNPVVDVVRQPSHVPSLEHKRHLKFQTLLHSLSETYITSTQQREDSNSMQGVM